MSSFRRLRARFDEAGASEDTLACYLNIEDRFLDRAVNIFGELEGIVRDRIDVYDQAYVYEIDGDVYDVADRFELEDLEGFSRDVTSPLEYLVDEAGSQSFEEASDQLFDEILDLSVPLGMLNNLTSLVESESIDEFIVLYNQMKNGMFEESLIEAYSNLAQAVPGYDRAVELYGAPGSSLREIATFIGLAIRESCYNSSDPAEKHRDVLHMFETKGVEIVKDYLSSWPSSYLGGIDHNDIVVCFHPEPILNETHGCVIDAKHPSLGLECEIILKISKFSDAQIQGRIDYLRNVGLSKLEKALHIELETI